MSAAGVAKHTRASRANPVVVPYGYRSYYLNVTARPKREWHFGNDPAHEWLLKR